MLTKNKLRLKSFHFNNGNRDSNDDNNYDYISSAISLCYSSAVQGRTVSYKVTFTT